MSEETVGYARRMWDELFNAHDLSMVDEWVAEGSVDHSAAPGTSDGPQGVREVFERMWSAFPDIAFEVEDVIADGSKVVCVGMMRGTHEGGFQGMEPTGKRFEAQQVHILSFDDKGRMTEHLAVRDDVAMLQQLGVLPEPPDDAD
jgi:steroid delta-isomerase-like uncharacterized protein